MSSPSVRARKKKGKNTGSSPPPPPTRFTLIITAATEDFLEIFATGPSTRKEVLQCIRHWVLSSFRLLPAILIEALRQVDGNIRIGRA
jgi:hypothetical protein